MNPSMTQTSRWRILRAAVGTIVLGLLLVATGCARSSGPGASSTPSATAGGSGGPSPSGPAKGSCSAAGLPAELPKQELPGPVVSTRGQIAKAATACDYDALDRLAAASKEGFSFSFGGQQGKPGAYWRMLEEQGRAPLAYLVKILSVPGATTTLPASSPTPQAIPSPSTIYVWPAAATRDVPTDSDWAALERVYPKEQVQKMRDDTARFGIGYLGWRTGITAAGTWIYFIEGD
jgi:hypothetical protein